MNELKIIYRVNSDSIYKNKIAGDIMTQVQVRQHLQTAIEEIEQKILRLSSVIDETLLRALTVCVTKDLSLAQQIIDDDKEIDITQKEIEDYCAQTIATEQPVATHLRYLIASIKVAASLERMGDYIRHICQNIDAVSSLSLKKYIHVIQEMAQTCSRMIKGSMDAFISRDENLAHDIADIDKTIDAIHIKLYREIIAVLEDEKGGTESSIAFIHIIRAFERIGDMVANICEHTIYVATGDHVDLN